MKRIYLIGLLCGICLSPKAQTFEDVQRRIVACSPGLANAKALINSELLQRKAENNLPDPEIEGEYQWGMAGVGDKWSVGVSQGFEWPGVYRARNRANKQATVAAEARIMSDYVDKMLEVKMLLIQYIAVKQRVNILGEIKGHIADLNDFYKTAYEHGETTILDLNKSAIEFAEIKSRYNGAINDMAAVVEAIQKEAGTVPVDGWLDELDQYPLETLRTEEEYISAIQTMDQSVKSADASTKAAAYDAAAVKASSAPGFSLGYQHVYELGERFNGITAGITLPVFSTRHKRKAAAYQVQAMNEAYASTLANRISEIKSCRLQAVRLSEQLAEIAPVVLDKRPAELLNKALKGGEISLLTYLQELNYFLEAQLDYADSMRDYQLLMARLNRYAVPMPD